ncbi:MAG TPA: hypothetical protein VKB51_08940 [bacterium]|nr:hypothetical protein [bacterium]
MKHRPVFAVALASLALLLVATWGGTAQALYLGNPAPNFKKGEAGVGLSLSDKLDLLYGDFGVSDAGTAELQAGTLDLGAGVTGSVLGLTYRQKVGQPFKLGNFPVTLAVQGGYNVDNIDTPFGKAKGNTFHIGLGGSVAPLENLAIFATAIYERNRAGTYSPAFGNEPVDSKFGAVVGAEYWATPHILAGIEAHPGLADDGASIYGEYKF